MCETKAIGICPTLLQNLCDPHNEEAWNSFCDEYKGIIFHYVSKMVHQKNELDDFIQEVSIHIWKKIDKYNPELSNFLTWLSRVIRNKVLDLLRSRATKQDKLVHLDSLSLIDEARERIQKSNSFQEIIDESLQRLKTKVSYKQYRYLKMYFSGCSTKEICSDLNINPANAYKLRARVSPYLRREIRSLVL